MTEFNLAEIDRLLTTTKSVRRRLDLTRPVPRQVVVESIRLGCFAPNASNAQEWRWVVVDDPEQRRLVGEQYAKVTIPSVTQMLESKLSNGDEVGACISRSIIYLAETHYYVTEERPCPLKTDTLTASATNRGGWSARSTSS